MLGLDNPIHILFVLIVLLLVFGAKRLPEMGKSMGEGMRGFKESLTGETPMTHMTDDHTARVSELASAPGAVAAPAPEQVEQPVAVTRERTASAA
jgi:sec-independent protein translocase protein TatA